VSSRDREDAAELVAVVREEGPLGLRDGPADALDPSRMGGNSEAGSGEVDGVGESRAVDSDSFLACGW